MGVWPEHQTADCVPAVSCVKDRWPACPRVQCAAAEGRRDPSHGSATRQYQLVMSHSIF